MTRRMLLLALALFGFAVGMLIGPAL